MYSLYNDIVHRYILYFCLLVCVLHLKYLWTTVAVLYTLYFSIYLSFPAMFIFSYVFVLQFIILSFQPSISLIAGPTVTNYFIFCLSEEEFFFYFFKENFVRDNSLCC